MGYLRKYWKMNLRYFRQELECLARVCDFYSRKNWGPSRKLIFFRVGEMILADGYTMFSENKLAKYPNAIH